MPYSLHSTLARMTSSARSHPMLGPIDPAISWCSPPEAASPGPVEYSLMQSIAQPGQAATPR